MIDIVLIFVKNKESLNNILKTSYDICVLSFFYHKLHY